MTIEDEGGIKDYAKGDGGLVQVAGTRNGQHIYVSIRDSNGRWSQVMLELDAAKHFSERLQFYLDHPAGLNPKPYRPI